MPHDVAFLDDLALDGEVSLAKGDIDDHSEDFGAELLGGHPPDAVVYATSTDDVRTLLPACDERGVPVTPFAAGTSMEANPVPVEGGVSLDLTRMDAITGERFGDLQVDVQPGVFGGDLDDHVGRSGLFFPPLPQSGEISTIGGMIANDAAGRKTVRYGEVKDWVLAVEAILADGTRIRAGSRTVKTSAGYNLKDLIVGSEGTLAVVTEATLRLAGRPREIVGGRALFASLDDAGRAVTQTIQSGVDVASIELVDRLAIEMANDFLGLDLPARPGVFLEFHGNSADGVRDEIERTREIFEACDVQRWEMGKGRDEMATLWEARDELAFAIVAYDPDLQPLHAGDVTVPIGRFPEMLRFAKEAAADSDLLCPCFGHAGDGNLHFSVLVDVDDPDRLEVAEAVHDRIVRRAIELGGTSTGEHGIGAGKQGYLVDELGEESVEAMRKIKEAWDPNGTLNPGKIF